MLKSSILATIVFLGFYHQELLWMNDDHGFLDIFDDYDKVSTSIRGQDIDILDENGLFEEWNGGIRSNSRYKLFLWIFMAIVFSSILVTSIEHFCYYHMVRNMVPQRKNIQEAPQSTVVTRAAQTEEHYGAFQRIGYRRDRQQMEQNKTPSNKNADRLKRASDAKIIKELRYSLSKCRDENSSLKEGLAKKDADLANKSKRITDKDIYIDDLGKRIADLICVVKHRDKKIAWLKSDRSNDVQESTTSEAINNEEPTGCEENQDVDRRSYARLANRYSVLENKYEQLLKCTDNVDSEWKTVK